MLLHFQALKSRLLSKVLISFDINLIAPCVNQFLWYNQVRCQYCCITWRYKRISKNKALNIVLEENMSGNDKCLKTIFLRQPFEYPIEIQCLIRLFLIYTFLLFYKVNYTFHIGFTLLIWYLFVNSHKVMKR